MYKRQTSPPSLPPKGNTPRPAGLSATKCATAPTTTTHPQSSPPAPKRSSADGPGGPTPKPAEDRDHRHNGVLPQLSGNGCVTMTVASASSTTSANCLIAPAGPDSHRTLGSRRFALVRVDCVAPHMGWCHDHVLALSKLPSRTRAAGEPASRSFTTDFRRLGEDGLYRWGSASLRKEGAWPTTVPSPDGS